MPVKTVCALAWPSGSTRALARIDVHRSPDFRAEFIAPSPVVSESLGRTLSQRCLRHKRTQRLDASALTVFWAMCLLNITVRRTTGAGRLHSAHGGRGELLATPIRWW